MPRKLILPLAIACAAIGLSTGTAHSEDAAAPCPPQTGWIAPPHVQPGAGMWQQQQMHPYGTQSGFRRQNIYGLPTGRRYFQGRYFGNYNNRFYGPQYGYF